MNKFCIELVAMPCKVILRELSERTHWQDAILPSEKIRSPRAGRAGLQSSDADTALSNEKFKMLWRWAASRLVFYSVPGQERWRLADFLQFWYILDTVVFTKYSPLPNVTTGLVYLEDYKVHYKGRKQEARGTEGPIPMPPVHTQCETWSSYIFSWMRLVFWFTTTKVMVVTWWPFRQSTCRPIPAQSDPEETMTRFL